LRGHIRQLGAKAAPTINKADIWYRHFVSCQQESKEPLQKLKVESFGSESSGFQSAVNGAPPTPNAQKLTQAGGECAVRVYCAAHFALVQIFDNPANMTPEGDQWQI